MSELQQVLDELVVECTESLFESIGLSITHVATTKDPCELVGIIGFAGSKLRGVVGLSMSPQLAVRAVGNATEGETPVDDWVAEAANQLLGRIKNRLLQKGVAISAALPIVLRGIEVRLAPRSSQPVRVYSFSDKDESAVVWLDLQTAGEIAVAETVDAAEQPMDEGDLMLF
ncbi:MAG TPA: chemotaxis protein CheX [Polyangiaceae bacterium]|nr:chemotaxis protein CheX [Polyangiaceae bacterium]